ncbi:MAG: LacI family DNA-binding transcriptional regulator [Bacillota bacterium]
MRSSGAGRVVTLRDIAARVGVSVTAVSRALNGHPDVSEATRQRILEAARQLNYRPNAAAKTLATQRSHLIGVYFLGEGPVRFSHPFASQVVDGILEGLAAAGYDLLVFGAGLFDSKPSFLELAAHRQLDGAIFLGLRTDDPRWGELTRLPFPICSVDVPVEAPRAVCVGCDHIEGARLAARHLVELGHRDVAMVNGHRWAPVSWERLSGFTAGLQQAGVELPASRVLEGDFTEPSGYQLALGLLSVTPRPTAIFAASDLMALGVLRAARELGIAVPAELSVVGYDDIEDAARAVPALTTIHQPRHRVGLAAAQSVVQLIERGDATSASRVLLRPQLVVRASTGPAPG